MKHFFIHWTQKHKLFERFFASFRWYRAMVIREAFAVLSKSLYEKIHEEVADDV